MQVDVSHGIFPHRMIVQKDSRHDNGFLAHPPVMDREKDSSKMTVKKEVNDSTTAAESLESVSTMHLTDNPEEESSNDQQEDTPCSVKTKPYYSINAKLSQRERWSTIGNVLFNKSADKGCTDDRIDETVLVTEERNPLLENVKPPSILDPDNANFGFLTASVTSRISQMCNKASVTCLICGKQLSNQYNLRVHMETHSNSSYSCTACSHVSRSRDALRKHVSYRHPVTSPQKRSRYSSSKS